MLKRLILRRLIFHLTSHLGFNNHSHLKLWVIPLRELGTMAILSYENILDLSYTPKYMYHMTLHSSGVISFKREKLLFKMYHNIPWIFWRQHLDHHHNAWQLQMHFQTANWKESHSSRKASPPKRNQKIKCKGKISEIELF